MGTYMGDSEVAVSQEVGATPNSGYTHTCQLLLYLPPVVWNFLVIITPDPPNKR